MFRLWTEVVKLTDERRLPTFSYKYYGSLREAVTLYPDSANLNWNLEHASH